MLGALAGCAVGFIRETLTPQLGLHVDAIEATAKCEADSRGLFGMAGAAPDLQNLQLSIRIRSPEPQEKVERVYRTWQERWPIYLALAKPVAVGTTLEVERTPGLAHIAPS